MLFMYARDYGTPPLENGAGMGDGGVMAKKKAPSKPGRLQMGPATRFQTLRRIARRCELPSGYSAAQ